MTSKKYPFNESAGLIKLTACAVGCLTLPFVGSAQEAAPPSVPVIEPSAPSDLLRWGAVTAHPYAGYTALYDDNIDLGQDKIDDLILHLTPGIALHAGDTANQQERYMLLDYSPDFTFFIMEGGSRNAIDHRGNLSVLWPMSKLTLGLSQDYMAITEPSVDVGARIQSKVYNTRLTSRYQLSDKTSFEVNGRYVNRDYDDIRFTRSQEFINDDWFNYHVSEKLTTSVGVMFGWLDPQSDIATSPSQQYQRGLVRATYALTEKFEWNAQAGAEVRQFQEVRGSKRSDRVSPVFGLGAIYHATERTSLSLNANREENNSSVIDTANYTSTSVMGSIRQELGADLFFTIAGGYVNSDYYANQDVFLGERTDNYFFIRPSLDAMLGEHWKTGVFLQYRENDSNRDAVDFDNFQAGMQASYTF